MAGRLSQIPGQSAFGLAIGDRQPARTRGPSGFRASSKAEPRAASCQDPGNTAAANAVEHPIEPSHRRSQAAAGKHQTGHGATSKADRRAARCSVSRNTASFCIAAKLTEHTVESGRKRTKAAAS